MPASGSGHVRERALRQRSGIARRRARRRLSGMRVRPATGGLTCEKQDDDQRVENGEPLDVGLRHRLEDVVPARGPAHLSALEAHVVGVGDLKLIVELLVIQRQRQRAQLGLAGFLALPVVLHRLRGDLHGDDAPTGLDERRTPRVGVRLVVSADAKWHLAVGMGASASKRPQRFATGKRWSPLVSTYCYDATQTCEWSSGHCCRAAAQRPRGAQVHPLHQVRANPTKRSLNRPCSGMQRTLPRATQYIRR